MKQIYTAVLIAFMAQSAFTKGTLTYPKFFSKTHNMDKTIALYLPDGYNPADSVKYPVIYFLHGGYSDYSPYIEGLAGALDFLIETSQIHPVILVAPDGSGCFWGGCFWANSELYGTVEDYVTEEVVAYVDQNYLTVPSAEGRSILGFSDGGDGAMAVGLRHPHIYRSIAAFAGFFDWDLIRQDFIRLWVLGENSGPPYHYEPNKGTLTMDLFRVAGAYSPNLYNPPYGIDFPFDENGNVDENVLSRWKAYNADVLVAALAPEEIPDLYFSCGDGDGLNYQGNLSLKTSLDKTGVPYTFVPFSGGHLFGEEQVVGGFMHIDKVFYKQEDGVQRRVETTISGMKLYDNFPNPFNPSTTISFELAQDGIPVQLLIYNSSGEYVATLADGRLTKGHHEIVWNGLDQQGNSVASGVYLYRFIAGHSAAAGKMTLLK